MSLIPPTVRDHRWSRRLRVKPPGTPGYSDFRPAQPCSSALRRRHGHGRAIRGYYSGSSMSTGCFCQSICAAHGSAAAYWQWQKKEAGDAGCTDRADDAQRPGAGFYQKQGYDPRRRSIAIRRV